jgi:hypothetical protein
MPKRFQPAQRFFLQTSQAVFEKGALRQVTVEAQDGFAVLRLKGLAESYPVPWGAVYHLAVADALEREFNIRKARLKRGAES